MSDKTERNNVGNTPGPQTQAAKAGSSNNSSSQNVSNRGGGSSIFKNALKMAFGTMTSRVLGLLRESLLAALFDKHVTDAWNVAFRVPNLFRRLLGEGSLSVSFIPVFVEAHLESDRRASNLVNSLYTVLLMVLATITTLGVLFPAPLLNLFLDPSYIANTEKYMLTVHLARIMFLFVFFISSFAFFMGILNALGQFFWPALAPTFWNLSMVASTIWPKGWLSTDTTKYGDQLAWGVVIGGVLQAGILIPSLVKAGFFPKFSFDFKNRDMLHVFRNMGPGLIGMGLLQFMTIVNNNFASGLHEGTLSFINYVDRLIELTLSLISVSLGTALLPVLSKFWSKNEKSEMAQTAQKYLELNFLVSIAAACGMFSLAEPIIKLIFGRGHFSDADVVTTALILKTYCWIMIFSSGVRVLTPAYYAVKNTWFPAVVSACCLVTHILVAPLLMERWQVQGLMISTTLSAALNFFALLLFFQIMITGFNYFGFFKHVMKFIVIGVLVYSVSQSYFYVRANLPDGFVGSLIGIAFSVILSAVVFILAARTFRVQEIEMLLSKLSRRLK